MKSVILFLSVMFLAFTGFSQSSDPYLSTQYLGYVDGVHKVKVTNLQSCDVDIQFGYAGTVINVQPNPNNNFYFNRIPASTSQIFEITGGQQIVLIVKALSICDWHGVMPTWVDPLSNVLPVKFKSIKLTQISKSSFRVAFEIDEELNVKQYAIKINDGSGFKVWKVLFPNETISPGRYSAVINIGK